MLKKLKLYYFKAYRKLMTMSLIASNKQRGEAVLKDTLCQIVPDLSGQYTTWSFDMKETYITQKIRGQHSFQIALAQKAISLLGKKEKINVVDIGDSAGTHVQYINSLFDDKEIEALSVNFDPIAIEKIQAKGLKAVNAKAQDLHKVEGGVKADIFLSFQMLEHLMDPIGFMRSMATDSTCEYFAISVPLVRESRLGLGFISSESTDKVYNEGTHIFELSPADWDKIFKFTGWEIVYRDEYTQYPLMGLLKYTKPIWKKRDFEGFYGVVLKKSSRFSKLYQDW